MKDWVGYLKEHVNSDLWGFVLLDYYHQQREQGHEKGPSHFIDQVISKLPEEVIDPVAFHNVLLSVSVHLLSPDFPDIMKKSISWIKGLQNRLSEAQRQSIILHYGPYNKQVIFAQNLASSILGITEIPSKPEDVRDEDLELSGIREAIKTAEKCKPEDERIHPKVGAVIIKNNKIVCTAYRGEINPGEHAEYTALAKKCQDMDLTGATLITTLEPCTARGHGKKPCALHIADSGINKVIIGILDPNPDIRGNGVIFLQQNKIKVEHFPSKYQDEVIRLNEKYWRQEVEKYKDRTDVMRHNVSETERRGEAAIPSFPISEGFHQELPPEFMKDPFKHTRLLQYYSRNPDLVRARPFKGKRVLLVLHFLRDFIPFVKAAVNFGLEMKNAYFFYKEYPYPQKEAVRKWLEEQFINEKASPVVRPRSHISQFLKQLAESPAETIGRILIVEDGGFFVPSIHKEFCQFIPHIIGAVEQTTRGIKNAEDWEKEREENKLQFPVISVATSELKRKFEPPYIAEAVVDNIKRFLPHISLKGKTCALFGYGTIGEKLAYCLRHNGVDVMIFEPDPGNKLQAHQAGFPLANSPVEAVQNKDFVIGASGSQSISSQVIANLGHGTYVLSTSSELYEIDIEELLMKQIKMTPLKNESQLQIGTDFVLPPKDKVIHLLANGYPINFWGFESMPEEASSLILTLLLLSSAEVALGNYPAHGINSDAVNQIAKKYKVAQKFLEFYRQG
jgi:S-adenosylhomocysteine hydrolase/pyrimidine deaminase RibD-like protein